MSELVNFEPAKNGKISVVVGGISFLCDTEEDGRRRAATMLLREVVRLRSEQNNPVEQLANVRRELELFEAGERVQPELLNELDKDEWWDVVQTCQPQISRQEFELMWNKFQALKEKRMKQ